MNYEWNCAHLRLSYTILQHISALFGEILHVVETICSCVRSFVCTTTRFYAYLCGYCAHLVVIFHKKLHI